MSYDDCCFYLFREIDICFRWVLAGRGLLSSKEMCIVKSEMNDRVDCKIV